jgi:hypothetical protein
MKTKLTLTVEEEIVRKTKQLAKRRHTSVSALFEQWSTRSESEESRSALGDSLRGKWHKPDTRESGDLRLEAILEKHAK